MDSIVDSLVTQMQGQLVLEKVLTRFIAAKFKLSGVIISKATLGVIETQIKEQLESAVSRSLDMLTTISFQFEDDELEAKHPELFKDEIQIAITSDDVDKFENNFYQLIETALPKLILEMSVHLLDEWKNRAPELLQKEHSYASDFNSKLHHIWGAALTKLETLFSILLEIGAEFNKSYRPKAVANTDYVFEALTLLHAKGSQVACEVFVLLSNGLADGADARWRTLHELTITACFLHTHGNDVAERYLLHHVVDSFKLMSHYQKYYKTLGYSPPTSEEIHEVEDAYNSVLDRFGKSFKEDYGWAAHVLGKTRPTFYDIEQNADFEHFRPLFKMSSNNVHATSQGNFARLGSSPHQRILVAGPSIFGLSEPACNSAYSYNLLTAMLLYIEITGESLVTLEATTNFVTEIFEAFGEAADKLETEDGTKSTKQ